MRIGRGGDKTERRGEMNDQRSRWDQIKDRARGGGTEASLIAAVKTGKRTISNESSCWSVL